VISSGRVTCRATRPEKTDVLCEEQLGFGTAKAVVTSRAVTVHVSTPLASSQELMARALPMSQPFPFYSPSATDSTLLFFIDDNTSYRFYKEAALQLIRVRTA
jgi:hypothetical protein